MENEYVADEEMAAMRKEIKDLREELQDLRKRNDILKECLESSRGREENIKQSLEVEREARSQAQALCMERRRFSISLSAHVLRAAALLGISDYSDAADAARLIYEKLEDIAGGNGANTVGNALTSSPA